MKKIHIVLISIAVVLALLIGGCATFLLTYYAAIDDAVEASAPIDAVEPTVGAYGEIAFIPEEIKTGFIFYPGGRVEAEAYYPFMQYCAEMDILAVLVPMPFNLAVFDIDAAIRIKANYQQVDKWYIGGHSHGGSMAAICVENNPTDFLGLVLLGAYSANDISNLDVDVLSIYGSEDGVMNKDKYEQCRKNLPSDFSEVVIEGAHHAGFGVYGAQFGDGIAYITNIDQIMTTAVEIYTFMLTSALR
jgi:hypothetical protein